ncbi:fusaric acid resistance-like protein [Ceratobasidium sp. AG-Ba]|nr:fusaric acid resistance-like protein [Ceratobasidium sp. AG-Ba]
MSSRGTPAQSGTNTPHSLGAYATLPRRTNRSTPAESLHDEFRSAGIPITIRQRPEASSYFGSHAPVASPEQGLDGLQNLVSRSLGPGAIVPSTPGARQTGKHPDVDRQWTTFGQLLEDDGAFRPRQSRRATITSIRPRPPSNARQETVPPLPDTPASGARRPLSARSVSRESRQPLLSTPNPSSSDANLISEEPPADEDLTPRPRDDESDWENQTASLTAGSHKSALTPERRPEHHRHASYDDSDDSDDSEDESDRPSTAPSTGFRSWLRFPKLSPLQKKVLKCSIAYTVGCLFTFVPSLSSWLTDIVPLGSQQGPSPTGHMVATITVYYNPAVSPVKSIGGMIEADLFCLVGAAFASFASLVATQSFWFFELQPGWEWLADALVLSWLAVSMMLIAWSKLWVNKPTFGSACSMTSIILFVVIVKEGGTEVLTQVLFITVLGICIANAACFLLWPESATTSLQKEMTATLSSFSTLLKMLTNTFLLDESQLVRTKELSRAVEAHQKSFTSLKKVLAEARAEWCDPRIQRTAEVYEEAVVGLNRLAQHFGGLRSGTKLQFELIQSRRKARGKSKESSNGKAAEPNGGKLGGDTQDEEEALLKAAEAMFGSLVDDVESPMKALSNACVNSLETISTAFNSVRRPEDDLELLDFASLRSGIDRALHNFESTSDHAVMRLFRRGDGENQTTAASTEALDRENETVLLVFFFIFTLKEFAGDLMAFVEVMGAIYITERRVALEGGLKGWIQRHLLCCIPRARNLPLWMRGTLAGSRFLPKRNNRPSLRRRLSALGPAQSQNRVKLFPKVTPHAPNTALRLPRERLTRWGRIKQSFWVLGQTLRAPEVRYSIKAGLSVAILAAPAFIESTRETFMEYRGEWALISCFVVLSPTVGATNFLSLHRIMGTLIGATFAVVVFSLFKHQPAVLVLCSFLYSLPCFYYIVSFPQYATSGRFVLLTYNLTCLFSYNSRDDNIPVLSVARHRATAVTIGVVWAFIVSRFWWPIEARRELGRVLSEFCFNIGWFYQCLVSSYSVHPTILNDIAAGKRSETGYANKDAEMESPTHLSASINEFMAMEHHLQLKLIELQALLAQTQNEPRLKGPFPVVLYRNILTSLQSILDMLHSLRCATTQEEWYTTVRKHFIVPVNKQRREMVGNVILYFSTLSAAFQLKTPMPPYLPPAEQARQKLVDAVRQLDIVKNREVKVSKHLLFFAYVLLMGGVIKELERLGFMLQEAFGVIGESADLFEALFIAGREDHDEESGQPDMENR